MDNITSFKTLIGSLYKKLNKASAYGTLELKTLFILDIINEFIYDCPSCYNNEVLKKLKDLSIQLQLKDKEICIYREERSIYTNILGCKDCNPNNTSLQVINTAPVIDNPPPVDEPIIIAPTSFENSESVKGRGEIIKFNTIAFTKGFIDPNNGIPKGLKIISLPANGILTYGGANVVEGQIIDLTLSEQMSYFALASSTTDIFKFAVSGSNYPNLYSSPTNFNIIIL